MKKYKFEFNLTEEEARMFNRMLCASMDSVNDMLKMDKEHQDMAAEIGLGVKEIGTQFSKQYHEYSLCRDPKCEKNSLGDTKAEEIKTKVKKDKDDLEELRPGFADDMIDALEKFAKDSDSVESAKAILKVLIKPDCNIDETVKEYFDLIKKANKGFPDDAVWLRGAMFGMENVKIMIEQNIGKADKLPLNLLQHYVTTHSLFTIKLHQASN